MPDVTISKVNELYIKLDCSADIRFFLYEQFCFEVPGFKFMPKYKSSLWDGKIRLFSSNTGKIYHGLFDQVTKVLDDNDFTWVVKDEKNRVDEKSKLSVSEIDAYIDSLKFPYELYDYQRDTIIECITNHRKLILSPTSSGKCHAKDTPILMYDGTIKMVQDIVVGDLIMGDDSTPRTVFSICTGEESMYRITPKKGDSWVCNESHILSLVSNSNDVNVNGKKILKNQIVDVNILDYLDTNKTTKHCLKQYRAKVNNFGNENNDVLDPYIFGVWLGDGDKSNKSDFHLNNNTKICISEHLCSKLSKFGYVCRSFKDVRNNAVTLVATNAKQNTLSKQINNHYYVEGKFIKTSELYIPHIFKTSSFENRLQLIAGLLDYDGSASTTGADFSCKSENFADDMCFICRSVGLAAYKTARVTHADDKPFNSFRISISGDLSIIPCIRLSFEKPNLNRNVLRTGITVTKLPVDTYYGFTLDGNNRYLLGDFTVTHNTTSIFALANYYKQFGKVLILFPTTSLILQTKKEFISFGADAGDIHEIMEDRAKNTDKPIVLSTWQGIYTQPKSYFQQYSTIITDECHTATAKSLTTILENLDNCKYRFGFTGTLDGSKVNKLILTGLFGDCKQVTTTTKLIENQQISDVKIKIVILKHKYKMFQNYSEEINYLIQDEKRNNVILNLVGKIKGNTLILTSRVEQHAIPLYNSIKNKYPDKCVHIVYGDIDTDKREEIRGLVETQDNAVIVASYQTYQAGISIKNLHNIIFALPSKSKIRNLQSIGRGLRLHKSKTHATIYDIADDISKGEHKNYTYNHLLSRINYYAAEELNFETIELNLNK